MVLLARLLGRLLLVEVRRLSRDFVAGGRGAVILPLARAPLGLRAVLALWLWLVHRSVAARCRTDGNQAQWIVILARPVPRRSMSTRPEIPGTLPELVYCQTE